MTGCLQYILYISRYKIHGVIPTLLKEMSVDELLMGVCTMIGVHRYKI